MIVSHAIGGDKHAGAIVTEAAVNEDLRVRISEERKKLRDLIVCWWRPAADGNIYELQSSCFGLFAFPGDFVGIFAAKIDDGGDTEGFQLLESFGVRLGTPEERIIDFSCVGEAGEFEFFAQRNWTDGGGRIIW